MADCLAALMLGGSDPRIETVDLGTLQTMNVFSFPNRYPMSIAATTALKRIYMTDGQNDVVVVVDGASGTVMATIPVLAPMGCLLSADEKTLFLVGGTPELRRGPGMSCSDSPCTSSRGSPHPRGSARRSSARRWRWPPRDSHGSAGNWNGVDRRAELRRDWLFPTSALLTPTCEQTRRRRGSDCPGRAPRPPDVRSTHS